MCFPWKSMRRTLEIKIIIKQQARHLFKFQRYWIGLSNHFYATRPFEVVKSVRKFSAFLIWIYWSLFLVFGITQSKPLKALFREIKNALQMCSHQPDIWRSWEPEARGSPGCVAGPGVAGVYPVICSTTVSRTFPLFLLEAKPRALF